jgi:hypothetical protein
VIPVLERVNLRIPKIPFPLLAIFFVVAALLTVSVWAVASPAGSSPDEDFHLGSIWCLGTDGGECVTSTDSDGTPLIQIPAELAWAHCYSPVPEMSGACTYELDSTLVWSTRFDAKDEFSGIYYAAMNLFTNGFDSIRTDVVTMRLFNGFLATGLFAAAAAAFSPSNRRLMAYGLLAVAAPTTVFFIASINPTGWGIAGVVLTWLGLHGWITEFSPVRRWGLLAIGAIGASMAAAARGDAGLFVIVSVLAVSVMHWQFFRNRLLRCFAPLGIAAIGVAGFLMSSQVGSATEGLATGDGQGGFLLDNLLNLPQFLIDTVAGPLNWLDTAIPAISRIPVILVGGGIVFIGLRYLNIPKALALIGLASVIVVVPLLILELSGAQLGLYFQARYLTPLIPLVLLTSLWDPYKQKVHRLRAPQLVILWGVLSVGHAWALHTQILRFTHGLTIRWFNLNTAVEWWDFGLNPQLTWALGSIAFSGLLLGLFAVSGRASVNSALPILVSEENENG